MKKGSLTVSAVVRAQPAAVYTAWLSSSRHSAMTGSRATASARVGGRHTAWDGYVTGRNLELVPSRRIVQSWRSTDFPEEAPDSRLVVSLVASARGTRVTLRHTGLPAAQVAAYRQGWKDYYLEPMKKYFAG